MLRDQTLAIRKRLQVVDILGAIGPAATDAVPDLKAIAASDGNDFADEVTATLTKIGSPDAVPALVQRFVARQDPYTLCALASLGSVARAVGPVVAKSVRAQNRELRTAAARTLGYIGYRDAIPELQSLLDDSANWKLVYAAAEALGRLKAESAASALNNVARHYWFPPVQVSAERALRSIRGEHVYRPHAPGSSYWEMMMDFSNEGATPRIESKGAGNRRFAEEPGTLSKTALNRMRYESPYVNPTLNAPHRVSMEAVEPNCGVRIDGGYLLGSDVGEFGGELGYRNERGLTWTLIHKNVRGIHRMPFGIVVTTGLAHLGLNDGTAWLVELQPGALPTAKPFKLLPGTPRESGILENGDLFIACNGGDVIITRTGEIRMADEP
jgi:hypothetical protein